MHPISRSRSVGDRSGPWVSGALLFRAREQLAALRDRELGRELGPCRRCGRPVRSQQDFVREHGLICHVRCRSSARR